MDVVGARPTGPVQPFLHELFTAVAAPTIALGGSDGQVSAAGAQGVYCADVRVLSAAELTVRRGDGSVIVPEPLWRHQRDAGTVEFLAALRHLDESAVDPTVWVRRTRTVSPTGMREHIAIENAGAGPLELTVVLALASDLADMELVKGGRAAAAVAPELTGPGVAWGRGAVSVAVSADQPDARCSAGPATAAIEWASTVPGRGSVTVGWQLQVSDSGAAVRAATPPADFARPRVAGADDRLERLLRRSLDDVAALTMAAAAVPDECFVAAGSPWYLTLFGRDSIWAARMLLPVSVELAGATLRTLAAFQGRRTDAATAEEPGKIPHEIRRPTTTVADPMLPPVYFGTVDATPLWICLLADAWRWGLPADRVRALLPALDAALAWMADSGDRDGDGFLEYTGGGLANQGWKDSGDSIRYADGALATGPVALCEVQAYAHQAAVDGAALLDAFDRPGGDRWRAFAAGLQDRFRASFWCRDERGPYPALALDGAKRRVDAVTSNMGHLLGTGILDAAESAAVADRLLGADMAGGFGLRTMSTAAGGYSPLSYHCGSVWPHDTAIAVHGLLRAGHGGAAVALARQLLAAGQAFDGRVPELFAGFSADEAAAPVPYPASCRPQAWSAAAAVVLLQTFLGLEVDVPAGTFRVAPAAALGEFSVSGLRLAGHPLAVTRDRSGDVAVDWAGPLRRI